MKYLLPHILALSVIALPALAQDAAPPEAQTPPATAQAPAESPAIDWPARAKAAFLATYTEACAGVDGDKMEDRAPEVFEMKYREASDEADAADRSVTLFRFECTRGAYNLGQVFFLRNGFDELQPLAFAEPDIQKCLGIVKRQRKPKQKLIIAPFPDKQRGSDQFFFQSSSKSPLTPCFQA